MSSPTPAGPSAAATLLRLARPDDEPFLAQMLFYAAHADEEPGMTTAQMLTNPSLARYVVGFGGAAGDLGVVAETGSPARPLGAAWVRVLAGDNRAYGWVDDAIPELGIAVAPEAVGRGLGSRMLAELLARARGLYPGVSLSVRRDNPARRLYLRTGFVPAQEVTNRVGGVSDTMVLRFEEGRRG